MNKKKWAILVSILALGGFAVSRALVKKADQNSKPAFTKVDSTSYWTCPMHPQVHLDHAGECPICHMKLVKVAAQVQEAEAAQAKAAAVSVTASSAQLELIGVQKTQVEKMDLTAHIPVSGRFISGSAVAFQVYEGDLRYIKPGIAFTGENGFYPGVEISGVITSVDSIVDPTSRTIRVVGAVRKGPKVIISETTFRGDIEIQLKNVAAIPESSVLHTGRGDIVYLIREDGRLRAQAVKLGLKTESYFEVLEGLEPGQFISSGPNFLIDSEAKIRGASEENPGAKAPACPSGQHWDIPMAMCMPDKVSQ